MQTEMQKDPDSSVDVPIDVREDILDSSVNDSDSDSGSSPLLPKSNIENKTLFFASIGTALIGLFISTMYYHEVWKSDHVSWVFWLSSMVMMYISLCRRPARPFRKSLRARLAAVPTAMWILVGGITLVYFAVFLMTYHSAPWNDFGLFDDAAWDIYFSKEYCFSGHPFQIIFSDDMAHISRELFFHYYISIFFQLFGYNLLAFNLSLMTLGYVSVLFVGLIARRLFNCYYLAGIAALLMMFYPLFFTQIFMGHRYAIAMPLMLISVFYFLRAFQEHRRSDVALGGFFAAFCVESAIMGKHYVYALLAAALVYAVFHFKKILHRKNDSQLFLFVIGAGAFVIALVPLVAYLSKHADVYMLRENSLSNEFSERLKNEGWVPLQENWNTFWTVLTSPFTYYRQFSSGFPALPIAYMVLAIPGAVIAFFKKFYILPIMIAVNAAGNLITITYDFRVLIAAPFYILSIVFVLWFVMVRREEPKKWYPNPVRYTATALVGVVIAMGFFPAVSYFQSTVQNPNQIHHLDHSIVATSRLLQDVVLGVETPSIQRKHDELRPEGSPDPDYDVMAAIQLGYAVPCLYLQDFDDRELLGLFRRFPYQGKTPEDIHELFVTYLHEYTPSEKGLKIALSIHGESSEVSFLLDWLVEGGTGDLQSYCDTIDDKPIGVHVYTIEASQVEGFRQSVIDWQLG